VTRTRRSPKTTDTSVPAPAVATTTPWSRRDRIAVGVAVLALWAALFAPQLFLGKTFVRGDAGRYSAYQELSRARWAESHERTLWNPYVFMGMPQMASLADPRPQWLPGPLLSAWDAVTRTNGGDAIWPALLGTLLGMLSCAALARRVWACGPAAAFAAAATWGLTPGLVVPLGFGHTAQTISVALMPVALQATEDALGARSRAHAIAWTLALAAVLALQVLGGHPQFAFYSAALVVAFAVLRAWTHRAPPRLVRVAVGAALAIAMSAATWLPALLYLRASQRGGGAFAIAQSRDFSLAVRDLASWVWPYAVGFGGPTYWGGMRATDFSHTLGMVGALLAVVALVSGGRGRRTAWALGAIALAAVALALGANLPVLGAALLRLPLLAAFRTPVTWLVVAQLAGALLVARGVQQLALATAERTPRQARDVTAAAIVAIVLAAGAWAARPAIAGMWLETARTAETARANDFKGGPRASSIARDFEATSGEGADHAARDLALELTLCALALLGIALTARRRDPSATLRAESALAILATTALASVSLPALWDCAGDAARLRPPPPTALEAAAAADPLHRAFPTDAEHALTNDWVAHRARTLGGMSAATPQLVQDLARSGLFGSEQFQRACAVKYLGGPGLAGLDSAAYEHRGDGVVVRRQPLSRAYGVSRVVRMVSDDAVIFGMGAPGWWPHDIALTAEDVGGPTTQAIPAITWTRDEPDELALHVRGDGASFVVIADTYFPGWSAMIDGRPERIRRVNHALRGVPVPAGEHTLAMRYVPEGWRAGVALSRLGWVLWLMSGLALTFDFVRRSPRIPQ
jgi:hypothetical protein